MKKRINKFRPIFKQIIGLRENVQNRLKVLKFKRKKWVTFLKFYKKKFKKYRKFKPVDYSKYFVTKHGTRGSGYQKRFRDTLQAGKRFRLFYGGLLKKYLKRQIASVLTKKRLKSDNLAEPKAVLLEIFESRLDVVLYRSKFTPTIRSARQLISHGKIYVNGSKVKSKVYTLRSGDLVSLDPLCLKLCGNNAANSAKWPIPPKHLVVNYRTMQISFLGNIRYAALSNEFSFNLRLQKILVNYPKQ